MTSPAGAFPVSEGVLVPARVGELAGANPVGQARRDLLGAGFAMDGDQLAHRRAERGLGERIGVDAVERGQGEGLAHIGQGRFPGVCPAALLKRKSKGYRHEAAF